MEEIEDSDKNILELREMKAELEKEFADTKKLGDGFAYY